MKTALLIDADNVSYEWFHDFLKILKEDLGAQVKYTRVYGDFSSSYLSGWNGKKIRCLFQPVQQFQKNAGNATDMRLIIDAMDLLYTDPELEAFCVASSDADYSSLLLRLRESGKKIYVMGGVNLSEDLRSLSDGFYIFKCEKSAEAQEKPEKPEKEEIEKEKEDSKGEDLIDSAKDLSDESAAVSEMSTEDEEIISILKNIIQEESEPGGWCKRIKLGMGVAKLKKEAHVPAGMQGLKVKGLVAKFKHEFEFKGSGINSYIRLKN